MIKVSSTAGTKLSGARPIGARFIRPAFSRAVIGLACVTALGMSVAGCAATAGASPHAAGSSTTPESVTLPSGAPSSAVSSPAAPSNAASSAVGAPSANQSTAAANGAVAGTPRCHTADLSASFTAVPGSAGAGNISYNLRLTNKTTHLCTIYGFPGMLLLDAQRRPLPTNVVWDSLVAKRLVWLIPNASAASTVRFSPDVPGSGDNGTAAPGQKWTCEPTAYNIEVTPPDETTQLVTGVVPPTPVCERGTMQTSAFIAGGTGPNQ